LLSLISARNAISAPFLYEQTDIMPKNQRRSSISKHFLIKSLPGTGIIHAESELTRGIEKLAAVFLNEKGESVFCFDTEGERRVIFGKYRNFHFRNSNQLWRCFSALAWPIFNGNVVSCFFADIYLTWPGNLKMFIVNHFPPLGNPAGHTADGEKDGEHIVTNKSPRSDKDYAQ